MRRDLGRTIWIATVAVISLGLMAIYSATSQNSRVSQDIFYDQLFCAVIGLVLIFLLSHFDYRKLFDAAYILYALNILLLVLVLVMGRHILGAKRWIEIGSFNFQPSEFTKLIMILLLSRYLSQIRSSYYYRSPHSMETLFSELLFPLFLTGVPVLLVFKQPDLGTAIMIFGILMVMLFAGGIKFRYLFSFLGICAAIMPFMWHILKPYQKDRLTVFLNPNADPLGAGYTIIQSKIAVGSGMVFGKGWLAGTQNQLNFLPERHTDFIFSVIGEEWGLLGGAFLLLCFFVLIERGLAIIEQTNDRFGFFMAVGIVAILTLQVVVNIGMVLGLLPVVGITLPMVSYGRTSFLTFVIMIGLLLSIHRRQMVS